MGHKITIPEVGNSLSVLEMASVGCYWEGYKIPEMCLIIPNNTAQEKYSSDSFCWSVCVIEHTSWWPLQHSFASADNVATDLFYCPINTMFSLEIVLHSPCVFLNLILVSLFHILIEDH